MKYLLTLLAMLFMQIASAQSTVAGEVPADAAPTPLGARITPDDKKAGIHKAQKRDAKKRKADRIAKKKRTGEKHKFEK